MYKIPANSGAGKKSTPLTRSGRRIRKTHPEPKKLVSLVAPCLNEAECIDAFLSVICSLTAQLHQYAFEFIFVNDGSTDDTLDVLLRKQRNDSRIVIVDLSRNFGKEAALSAGLQQARGEAVIPLDVDLQDPPELIPEMLEKWSEGYDVVLARRVSRAGDPWAKRVSASLFYRLHNTFADWPLPENVGDFRLMDRKVIEAMKLLPETNRFMKGLFAWLGFKTTEIKYSRPPRAAGRSKFHAWKLWNFALDGITGFSTAPLRIWTYVGLIFASFAFLYGGFIFVRTVFYGVDVPGYTSLLLSIVFLGGLQLMGIGVLGEYLGRTYMETKRRPVYIIRHVYSRKEPR